MKHVYYLTNGVGLYRCLQLTLVTLILVSCNIPHEPLQKLPINPNIRTLAPKNPEINILSGSICFPVYGPDSTRLYCIRNGFEGSLSGSIWSIVDSSIYPASESSAARMLDGIYSFLDISPDGNWLIAISDNSSADRGKLWLINVETLEKRLINDITRTIAWSAMVLDSDTSIIAFCTILSPGNNRTGFVQYSPSTGKDTVLLESGGEYLGFDIDRAGKRIFFGNLSACQSFSLETERIDTIPGVSGNWFRLNPDGTKLIFMSSSLRRIVPTKVAAVLDLQTGVVDTLDLNTDGDPYNFNYTPFADWLPDGRKIIFSQASLFYDGGFPGFLGLFKLLDY